MTGGIAALLGAVGENFAAGMTGGMAFVYDPGNDLPRHINGESVIHQRLDSAYWESVVKDLVAEHARETSSRFAQRLLDDWEIEVGKIWQVCPKEMIGRLEHPLSDEAEAARA